MRDSHLRLTNTTGDVEGTHYLNLVSFRQCRDGVV
eukprot:COSAG02_NODE_32196_length_520_cov_0.971496_1_plen_34_part_01